MTFQKILLSFLAITCLPLVAQPAFHAWAERPAMGWNSWDFYGTTITEAQTKAQADYMEANLKAHGWDLITVDIQWYMPDPIGAAAAVGSNSYHNYHSSNTAVQMDANGRLIPATTRFPSAAGGLGFKPLADYLHAKGLKFGIHLMRGIPRQAVVDNLPILGTSYTAQDIANTSSTCEWNGDMYGVDMAQPGAQAYYDSLFALYAQWGVDFVKIDDLGRPYHIAEIEGIREAIDKCGRNIVLSTSPGQTPAAKAKHIINHANQWRVMDDFWDNWGQLYDELTILERWTPYRGPGHFPDADMLPLGKIDANAGDTDGRTTNFTQNEQTLLMSLWAIARSPLIHGGDMTQMDAFTLSLLTNDEVIAVNQSSTHNRQLFRNGDQVAWIADDELSSDKYLALFNTGSSSTSISVDLSDLGFPGSAEIRDLWSHSDLGTFSGTFTANIPRHGAALYRLSGSPFPMPWITSTEGGNSYTTLSWEAVPGAQSYRVKRAIGYTGSFAVVAEGLTATSFIDIGLTNGIVHRYTVSAIVSGQETPASGVRTAIPMGKRVVAWNYNAWSHSPTYPTHTAGALPSANWNDTWLNRLVNPATFLWDSNGDFTPISVAWSTVNTWSIQNATHFGDDADGSLNREMLNGYLNAGSGSTSSVTFANIDFASYDVCVYFSSDVAGRQGTVTDGATTFYFNTIGASSVSGSNAVLTQATNTTSAGYATAANYAVFTGLTGSSKTISVNIPNWGGIAAIQILGNALPTGDYAEWIADYSVGALTGFGDDPDGDGIPNGVESVFGTDPSTSTTGITQVAQSGNTVTFQHPVAASVPADVASAYEWSTDLVNWHADGSSDGTIAVSFDATPVSGTASATATIAGTNPQRLFVRLKATQSAP